MIANLVWKETSGVDHPANEEEGWTVMKQIAPTEVQAIEELLKQESALVEKQERLSTALTAFIQSEEFGSLPKEAQAAAKVLAQFFGAQGYGYAAPKDEDTEGGMHPEDENPPANRKNLIQALLDAVHSTFSRQDKMKKALEASWPGFLSEISKILGSSADKQVKQAQLTRAIDGLKGKVLSSS